MYKQLDLQEIVNNIHFQFVLLPSHPALLVMMITTMMRLTQASVLHVPLDLSAMTNQSV